MHVPADGIGTLEGCGLKDSGAGRAMWKGGDEPSQSEGDQYRSAVIFFNRE